MINKNDTVTIGRHSLDELMRERDDAVARLKMYQENTAAVEKLTYRNKALLHKNEQLMLENYDLRKQLRSDAIEGIISDLQALLPDEA